MIGHLSTTIGLVKGDAPCFQLRVIPQDVITVATATQGVDVGMLQQEQCIGGLACFDGFHQFKLNVPSIGVFDDAQ